MHEEWIPGAFLHFFECLLAKELLDAVHFPACYSGALAAPQTYSHSLQPAIHTQLAHHYIQ